MEGASFTSEGVSSRQFTQRNEPSNLEINGYPITLTYKAEWLKCIIHMAPSIHNNATCHSLRKPILYKFLILQLHEKVDHSY